MHVTIFFQIALLIYVFHIFYLPVNTTAFTFKISTDRSVNSSIALLTTNKGSLKKMIDNLLFSLQTEPLSSECLQFQIIRIFSRPTECRIRIFWVRTAVEERKFQRFINWRTWRNKDIFLTIMLFNYHSIAWGWQFTNRRSWKLRPE